MPNPQPKPSVSGDCETCGEWSGGLYEGMCPPCCVKHGVICYVSNTNKSDNIVQFRDKPTPTLKKTTQKRLPSKLINVGALGSMSVAKFKTLVWNKPTTVIAEDACISDSMIGKLCRNNDIVKPPRGYWQTKNRGLSYKNRVKNGLRKIAIKNMTTRNYLLQVLGKVPYPGIWFTDLAFKVRDRIQGEQLECLLMNLKRNGAAVLVGGKWMLKRKPSYEP